MFIELWKTPQNVAKIRQEINQVLGSPDEQRLMAYEDIKSMPFLQAAYYEAIRLWPSVPKNIKVVAGDDIIKAGDAATLKDLPDIPVRKGEVVSWSDWIMARMPEVWGPDCAEYKPERFLEEPETVGGAPSFKNFSQWQFHAFNAGPRLCLGKNLATYEGMAVAAAILGRFDVVYDDERMRTDPPTFTDSVTLPCTPYFVGFQSRSV